MPGGSNGKTVSTNNYSAPINFTAQNAGIDAFQSVSVLNTSLTATVAVYLTNQPTGLPFIVVGPEEAITFPCQATAFLTFVFTSGTNGDGQVTLHGDANPLSSTSGTVQVSFPSLTANPGFVKFPNGLLFQWGSVQFVAGNNVLIAPLAVPFTVVCFASFAAFNTASGLSLLGNTATVYSAVSPSDNGISLEVYGYDMQATQQPSISWLAIGV